MRAKIYFPDGSALVLSITKRRMRRYRRQYNAKRRFAKLYRVPLDPWSEALAIQLKLSSLSNTYMRNFIPSV